MRTSRSFAFLALYFFSAILLSRPNHAKVSISHKGALKFSGKSPRPF